MKLVFFNDFKLGVLKGEQVVDVTESIQDIPQNKPHNLINSLISQFDKYRDEIEKASGILSGIPVNQVRIRPPLPKPSKILCMAVNYMDQLQLATGTEPSPINAFLKSPMAVIGQGDTIVLPGAKANIFEHEAELALVIGKKASNVNAADWKEYVFGYVNFIDVSARGLATSPLDSFFTGKSWDTFAPIGPYLVTADEITDPQNLSVKLWVNGVLRQDYSTGDMAHKIPRCIEWASSIATLQPGDILATGTNHLGLGPIQDSDTVEMEINGLGKLSVKVKDRLKRQWPPETRAQREARDAK